MPGAKREFGLSIAVFRAWPGETFGVLGPCKEGKRFERKRKERGGTRGKKKKGEEKKDVN